MKPSHKALYKRIAKLLPVALANAKPGEIPLVTVFMGYCDDREGHQGREHLVAGNSGALFDVPMTMVAEAMRAEKSHAKREEILSRWLESARNAAWTILGKLELGSIEKI